MAGREHMTRMAGATHADKNAGSVVAGNVTKDQPNPPVRGRVAAGRPSYLAVADATILPRLERPKMRSHQSPRLVEPPSAPLPSAASLST